MIQVVFGVFPGGSAATQECYAKYQNQNQQAQEAKFDHRSLKDAGTWVVQAPGFARVGGFERYPVPAGSKQSGCTRDSFLAILNPAAFSEHL